MGLAVRELCPRLAVIPPSDSTARWFAVTVKPQQESVVRDGLEFHGLETFVPTYCSARRWSDRIKHLQRPLFPGYVFCRFQLENRLTVLRTVGVRSIVTFGSKMGVISDAELDQIRRIAKSGSLTEPWQYLRTGQHVRIHQGPLTGLHGIMVEVRNTFRVVVGIEMLQRSVAVQLERSQVTPLAVA
jgi:transcription antitermination factor NusG